MLADFGLPLLVGRWRDGDMTGQYLLVDVAARRLWFYAEVTQERVPEMVVLA